MFSDMGHPFLYAQINATITPVSSKNAGTWSGSSMDRAVPS